MDQRDSLNPGELVDSELQQPFAVTSLNTPKFSNDPFQAILHPYKAPQ
jgi:hypothetical protein